MIRLIVISLFLVTAQGIQQPRLVYPRLLEERSPDGRMVLHLHDGLTLNLRKASIAAREFRVLENEDGREVTHLFNGEDFDRHLHEDEKEFASVHVMQKESGIEVEGVVGPYHRIQPMPEMERSNDGLIPHMIHEIEKKEIFDIEVEPKSIDAWRINERSSGSQNVPKEVTIELFIVSDYPHYSHFRTTHELILYLCVHVNSVNMRYTETSAPRIRFSLVGVQRDQSSPYKRGPTNYSDSSLTLDEFKMHAYAKNHEFGYPDMVFLMTGYEVYSPGPNKTMNTNVLGIGFVGGLCTSFFVALGQDTAGMYNGMHTLSHEAGHVLGASHDESPPKTWIEGDPGSLECKWKDGYMMSYVDGGPKHHRFSNCSLKQIQNLVILRGAACWKVQKKGLTNRGKYPGMEVEPNKYCKKMVFPDKSNVTADLESPHMKECKLKCQYPEFRQQCYYNNRCYKYTTIRYILESALDFMPCGAKEVCIRGVCMSKETFTTEEPDSPTQAPVSTTTEQDTPASVDPNQCKCDCSTTAAPTTARHRRPRRTFLNGRPVYAK